MFDYVVEVAEYGSMEWRDAVGGFVPVLGGWFASVMRLPTDPGDYFPNELETDSFRLPRRLRTSSFDYGDLERVLNIADATKAELAILGLWRTALVIADGVYTMQAAPSQVGGHV